MPAQLVTLDEAQAHLYLSYAAGDPRLPDLQAKLDAAEAAILDYINTTQAARDVSTTWDATTVPAFVKGAIKILCGELWRFRGDDAAPDVPLRDPLTDFSPTIMGLLRRVRDPVLV